MQRRFLSQEDQRYLNRWRLIIASFYSSAAAVVLLVIAFSAQRDNTTIEAQKNLTLAHTVQVVR